MSELDTVPFPVAYPLYWARDPGGVQQDAAKRARNAIITCYQSMRLAALLMLSDYLDSDLNEPALLSRIRGLRAPHWQEWSLLADELARFWTDPAHIAACRFAAVAQGWVAVSRVGPARGRTPALEAQWPALLAKFAGHGGTAPARSANEAVWALRNAGAHRQGTATPADQGRQEAVLGPLLALTEAIVQRLFGDGSVRLLRALPDTGGTPRVIHLSGAHHNRLFEAVPADPDWAEALAPTQVAAQLGDAVLPVYPLLVPTDHADWGEEAPAGTGLVEPVAMIDGVADRKLTVMGVDRAATVTGLHLDATLAALKRKHGDLSLGRQETAPWTVLSWSRMTVQQTLEELTGRKYFPAFYLVRPDVDLALDRVAQGQGLLLLGEAGSGKSSLVARLADRLCGGAADDPMDAEDTPHVVAYLAGRADYGGSADASADQLLVDAVARKLGVCDGGHRAFATLADLVMHLAAKGGSDSVRDRQFWLLLDGLNEADRFVDLIRALDAFLPTLTRAPQLRLVVSVRSGAYRSLAGRDARLGTHGTAVFAHAERWLTFPDAQGVERPWLEVRPFRMVEEGPRAYALRQGTPGLRSTTLAYDRLASGLRRLLLTPLYLHLFHETWSARTDHPGTLDEGGLLDAYLDQVAGGIAGANGWLDRLAEVMLAQRRAFLPVEEADRWAEQWRRQNGFATAQMVTKLDPVEELVAASLLLRPAEAGSGLERALLGYQFTQQKLAERVLLRHLDAALPPSRALPTRAELAHWMGVAAADPPFDELAGALAEWVTRLMGSNDPTVADTLDVLLACDAPSVRLLLISKLIATSAKATPEVAGAVFDRLVTGASKYHDGRNRFIVSAWEAADRLTLTATVSATRRVFLALTTFTKALVETDPGNAQAHLDLTVLLDRLGALAALANDGVTAQKLFGDALDISLRLAEAHPNNAEVQRSLSSSYDRLGILAGSAGDVAAARNSFTNALEIRKCLAEADPRDSQTQRGLLASYGRLGALAISADDGAGAKDMYSKALDISKRLAAADPSASHAQFDLSASYERLGEFAVWTCDGAAARDLFGKALKIRKHLAEADPGNTYIQRAVSICYDRLGVLAAAANDGAAAQDLFCKALEIDKRLSEADPDNAQAQLDLSAGYQRLGQLGVALDEGSAARDWFVKALEIAIRFAEVDLDNARRQRDLSLFYDRLGDLAVAANDGPTAREWFGKALEIAMRLAEADLGNVQWTEDVAYCNLRLGMLATHSERRRHIATARAALVPFLEAGNATARMTAIARALDNLEARPDDIR